MAIPFNPPEWLLKEYMTRKSPAEEASQGIQTALSNYVTLDQAKRRNALAEQQLLLDQAKAKLLADKEQREGREMFYNYADQSYLPENIQQEMNTQTQGPVNQIPLEYGQARDAQLGLAEGPGLPMAEEIAPKKSPIVQHFEAFKARYPQGIKGEPRMTPGNLMLTPEQLTATFSGDPNQMNKVFPQTPIAAARIAATAKGQSLVQERFDDKFEQSKAEKGATATAKTTKATNAINEGRQFLKDITAKHAELVDAGLAGDPIRKFGLGAVASVTGGRFGTERIKAFKDTTTAMIARLKKVTGDSGVMTDVDQQRLGQLFADLGETKEAAAAKLAMANQIFDLAERGEKQALADYLVSIGVKDSGDISGIAAPEKAIEDMSDEELQALQNGF